MSPQAPFTFHSEQTYYKGKVRDTYRIDDKLVMITTDRVSAFDHVLPREIPCKGAVLNGIASYFLRKTEDIVPNWLEATPHPMVAIGRACEPIKVEFVVRGYLAGHAWREYKAGRREICGERMPDGLRESERFEQPLITPATKADSGHDEDISRKAILDQGIMDQQSYDLCAEYALSLYERGTQMAAERGLILVDTKYEFGFYGDDILLIDEVHTPDSSRYYLADGYESRLAQNQRQEQLSKEFIREWLMENDFQGLEGQVMPDMPDDFIRLVSQRYIELYERLTGQPFQNTDCDKDEAYRRALAYLESLKSEGK